MRYLGLYLMYCWRQRGELIDAFKIINYLSNSTLSFSVLNNTRTIGHTKRTFVNYVFKVKYFFINRVVKKWNKLPDKVVQATMISVFKACL